MQSRLSFYFWLFLLLFFFALPVASQPTPVRIPRNHFVAKFSNIEIKDFLKTMAKITKRNILIDEKIRGKITIVSYRPIPVSRALDFMKQVLEIKGFAVVEERHLIKIQKIKEAGQVSIPQKRNPGRHSTGILSRVIKLPEGSSAQKLVGFLRPLIGKNTSINAYGPTNSLVLTGYSQNVRRAVAILRELGLKSEKTGPSIDARGVHIYRVKNMTAESIARVLVRLDNPQLFSGTPGKQKGKKGRKTFKPSRRSGRATKIKAVSHKESNTIVVTAGPEEWQEIKQIIEKLDTVRRQILLEVLIAEVSSSRLNDFGIDWRQQSRTGPHAQFNTGRVLEGGLIDASGKITGNNTLSGFSLGFLQKGGDLLGIFNANVNNQNFNVLSAPQILTLDNQEAEINVGQDVPVRTQERTSGGGTSEATVNSFDYKPAGIKLKFTPHINPDGQIGLELFQEVTSIEGGATGASNPIFSKRNIKTYITVKNKQTIVVGGLVSTEKLHVVQKIPLLGDIPFLGFLFRRTTYSTRKTNLMVFLTPHILDLPEDVRRITDYKRTEQIRASRKINNELKLWPEKKIETDDEDFYRKMNK